MIKRISAFFLAVVLVCSVMPFVSAREEDAVTPLVVVSGFGTVPLYLHANTPEAQQVFAPTVGSILRSVSDLALPTWRLRMSGDWEAWTQQTIPILTDLFEYCRCDENGNSVYDVDVRKFPLNAGNYPDFYSSEKKDEAAFLHTAMDTLGAENTYFFSYDWRLDPMDHADDLDAFIRNVQKETGAKKVVLAACSMGGVITMAYLYKYGASKLKSVILNNTAFQGITFVGEVFQLDVSIDKESMVNYLFQFVNIPDRANVFLREGVKRINLTDTVMDALQALADHALGTLADKLLFPLFGQMPGMWAFVSDAEYEAAKANVLDKRTHAALIRRIDNYHYNVQRNAKSILDKARRKGCFVTVLANYGKFAIPVTSSKMCSNDYLIDTTLASGGAICADNGKSLPDGYVQKKDRGHNHISPDRRIDASTCMYPECTWFIRDMGHLDFPYKTEGADFLMWLVCADRQLSVYSDARYPQFLVFNRAAGTLRPQ